MLDEECIVGSKRLFCFLKRGIYTITSERSCGLIFPEQGISLPSPLSLVQSDNFHSNSNLQFLKMLVEMFVRNSLQRLSEKIDYTFQLRTRLNYGILTALVMLTITSIRTWMGDCTTSDSVTFLESIQCHQSLCVFLEYLQDCEFYNNPSPAQVGSLIWYSWKMCS